MSIYEIETRFGSRELPNSMISPVAPPPLSRRATQRRGEVARPMKWHELSDSINTCEATPPLFPHPANPSEPAA